MWNVGGGDAHLLPAHVDDRAYAHLLGEQAHERDPELALPQDLLRIRLPCPLSPVTHPQQIEIACSACR